MGSSATENLRVFVQEAVKEAVAETIQADRVWTKADIRERTGLHFRVILDLEARGEFPQRIQLTNAKVGWLESEIREWLGQRPRGALPAPKLGKEE